MNSSSVTTSNLAYDERRQLIVLIRHGIALHNVIDQRTGEACNYRDPYFFDSPLLEDRIDYVIQMGKNVKEWFHKHNQNIELIITSPLTRCIQTTMLAFGPPPSNSIFRQENNLNVTGSINRNHNLDVPIVCKEVVREAFGKHYPDKRKEKSILKRNWPMIQFDENMTENDDLWKDNERETWNDIEIRVNKYIQWQIQRNESNIIVVTHGVFLERFLHKFAPQLFNNDSHRRVYNLDAYAMECITSSTSSSLIRIENVQLISSMQQST